METTTCRNGGFGLAMLVSLAMTFQPFAAHAAVNKPPAIQHDPVSHAVKGQSLTLKARVTDEGPGVQDVTLYYALFRDAAPFRVPMKASGLDFYVGTIDSGMIKDVQTIAYYIEATDKDGALAETPWYTVEFRKAEATPAAAGGANVAPETTDEGGTNWKTVGLIGLGVAAVAAGAIALGGGGGGGGGGDDGGGSNTNGTSVAGTYNGTVTTCLTVSGQPPSCESHACTIVIDSKGTVFSETLLQGVQMTDRLSGNDFVLTGQISNQGSVSNGLVNFDGTVTGTRIVGSVTGSAETSNGAGNYSGSFSATRQQ